MIDIEARLEELADLGLAPRSRLVSGPQGPHVVLDGRPVLLLCSDNYLGLADHPRVREAAAEAAMRWGVGAGAGRSSSGTMTVHRRLEERLSDFLGRRAALLFGSGYLAAAGAVAALVRAGDVVFSDRLNHPALADGCRLSRAEVFVYEHGDLDHLAWGIEHAEGRGALIVTEGVFAVDGTLAPLEQIAALARSRRLRTLVAEGDALGTVGPGGRGSVAGAGLYDEIDLVVGTLGKALGSHGGFAAGERTTMRYLAGAARTARFSTALCPPAAAAALAALDLLRERPEQVHRLTTRALALRAGLAAEGMPPPVGTTPVVSVPVGESRRAAATCALALESGVLCEAVRPPGSPPAAAALRLTVMAGHHRGELRAAAQVVARALRSAAARPAPASRGAVFDVEARAA